MKKMMVALAFIIAMLGVTAYAGDAGMHGQEESAVSLRDGGTSYSQYSASAPTESSTVAEQSYNKAPSAHATATSLVRIENNKVVYKVERRHVATPRRSGYYKPQPRYHANRPNVVVVPVGVQAPPIERRTGMSDAQSLYWLLGILGFLLVGGLMALFITMAVNNGQTNRECLREAIVERTRIREMANMAQRLGESARRGRGEEMEYSGSDSSFSLRVGPSSGAREMPVGVGLMQVNLPPAEIRMVASAPPAPRPVPAPAPRTAPAAPAAPAPAATATPARAVRGRTGP